MTRNGKDRLAAALGESYPRVWRGLGLESKNARNLPAIQDKKRTREDDRVGHPYPAATRAVRGAIPTSRQRMRCHRIPTLFDKRGMAGNPRADATADL